MNAGGTGEQGPGEILRQARRMAGLTQEQLAEQTGLSVRAIGDLERGQTARPHRRSVRLLAEALELPPPAYEQLMEALRQQMAAGASDRLHPGPPAGRRAARLPGGDSFPDSGQRQQPSAFPRGVAAEAVGGTRLPGPAAPGLLPAQLPADIADFAGRSEQVGRLWRILSGQTTPDSPGAVTIALVAGAGGTGKTTLAVHAAHLLRRLFPDGQFFADLLGASQRPAEPAELLARFLCDLGMHPARIPVSDEGRAAQYRSRLTGRQVLIVLDNARDAAQVRPLLPGSASCAVLVTSRNRMPDLAGTHFVDLDVLDPVEARTLFASIIGPARAAAEPDASERVLRACAGLPLAIRIAGARLAARGGWTVRSMAERLSDERRRLDELKTGNLAVRACFDVGVSSLPAPGNGVRPAHAFRMLGLWQGPFIGLGAAAALLGQPEEPVTDAVEALLDAQLLRSPAPDRYEFHDLLKAYAASLAAADLNEDDRHEAVRRALTWYLHTVVAMTKIVSPHREQVPLAPPELPVPPLAFPTVDEALNWCEAERANLVAATLQAANYGLHEIAWKLPVAALSFFFRRACWTEWITTHRIALASARQAGDRMGEAWVLNNLGMVHGELQMPDAVGFYEQALAIRRETGDQYGEAQAANNLAHAYLLLQRCDEALEWFQRALDIQRRIGHRYGEAFALNNLGEVYLQLGRAGEATRCLQQAFEIFIALGDTRGEGHAWHNLGRVSLERGRTDEALDRLQRALKIRRAGGDHLAEARTLRELGRAQCGNGLAGEARESWTRAVSLFEAMGDLARADEVRTEFAALDASHGVQSLNDRR
jgi:tetratricopeptide (TPR) repeat protein/transcriptional regulator with XRE-family HTH domain